MRRMMLLAAAMLLVAPAGPAGAQAEAGEAAAILIILDASGSMDLTGDDGVPRIEKAKQAVLELIAGLPEDTLVGLRVYGHREGNDDPVAGCRDTELLAPVAPLRSKAIEGPLRDLEASGFTPIGLSLREAAEDLPESGRRTIVLISDGEDTCGPPEPCTVAESVYGKALDVRVETVGFLLGSASAAEEQLRCIAEVTGGAYRTVDDAADLLMTLNEVAAEAIEWRPARLLDGALQQEDAPELVLPVVGDAGEEEGAGIASGEFRSVLMPGETRWWRFRLWEGEAASVLANLSWPQDAGVGGFLEGVLIGPDGELVEYSPEGTSRRVDITGFEPTVGVTTLAADTAGIAVGPPPGPGAYLLGVRWGADPAEVRGSVRFTVDVLRTEPAPSLMLEGSGTPAGAPAIPLDLPDPEREPSGVTAVREFVAPAGAGETRWFRLELEPGEVAEVSARLPADRTVAQADEGRITLELRTEDGRAVGAELGDLGTSAELGRGVPQARVGMTTSSEPDPLPETIVFGLGWEGPDDAESVAWVSVEAVADPDRPLPEPPPVEEEITSTTTTSSTTTTTLPPATTTPSTIAAAADGGDGGLPLGAAAAAAGGAVVAVVATVLWMRRRGGGEGGKA